MDDRPPTVLITGSSGHLGTALALHFASLSLRTIGIDVLPSAATTHVGSIADRAFVRSVLGANPSIRYVLHTATLHKPHIASHSKEAFHTTNILGTQVLLEEAVSILGVGGSTTDRRLNPSGDGQPPGNDTGPAGVGPGDGINVFIKERSGLAGFIFFSTTSTFGTALSPPRGDPAAWIDESVPPKPKNIYGETKLAAEDLCLQAHRRHGLPVVVLRTSRFFPEADDDPARRAQCPDDANIKLLELAYRRVDLADVAAAALCAMERAGEIGWGVYIISAPPPFTSAPGQHDATSSVAPNKGEQHEQGNVSTNASQKAKADPDLLAELDANPAAAFERAAPGLGELMRAKGWRHFDRVDRVYDSARAVRELGWRPEHTFTRAVEAARRGEDWRSELARRVGARGYHAESCGVYTTR